MSIYCSEAIALSAAFEDAATELKVIYNLLKMSLSETSMKDLSDRFFTSHVNRILSKYSIKGEWNVKFIPEQTNNSATENRDDSISGDDYRSQMLNRLAPLIRMFSKLSDEIVDAGTYTNLEEYVKKEQDELKSTENMVKRTLDSIKVIQNLQAEAERSKTENEQLLNEASKSLSHLKDLYQETKAKAEMEKRYMANYYEAKTAQLNNRYNGQIADLNERIRVIQEKIEQETRVGEETRAFHLNRVADMNEQHTALKNKMREKTEELREKLKALNKHREANRKRFEELKIQYDECEAVVLADRAAKEKIRRMQELQEKQEVDALRIQNWWRCQLVQRNLGPYAKKKKKGGKKGAKKGAKKKA